MVALTNDELDRLLADSRKKSANAELESGAIWDRESYELYLEELLHNAELSGDKAAIERLKGELSGVSVRGASEASRVSDEAGRHDDVAQNIASEAAQVAVSATVHAGMDEASKNLFDSFKPGEQYDIMSVHDNGTFDPSMMCKVDGKELQDAFANLEFGRMDSGTREGIIEQIQQKLGMDSNLSEEERMRSLKPALDEMEQYKAAQIFLAGGDMKEIAAKINANHQAFDSARAQVQLVIDKQHSIEHGSAPDELKDAAKQALAGDKQNLGAALDQVHNLLLGKTSTYYAVTGGKGVNAVEAGLPPSAKGSSGAYVS